MSLEIVGLGPHKYCIIFNGTPLFPYFLKIVLTFLSRHKMFIYPFTLGLENLYNQENWRERTRNVCTRASLTSDEFKANFPNVNI